MLHPPFVRLRHVGFTVLPLALLALAIGGCSRNGGQCTGAVAGAQAVATSLPASADPASQPVSLLVALSADTIEEAVTAGADLLATELEQRIGGLPGGVEPEFEYELSDFSLLEIDGRAAMRFRLGVSGRAQINSPLGALTAGADGSGLVTAAFELRQAAGGTSVHLDPASTAVTEVTAEATGLGAIAQPVAERFERGLREVLNSRAAGVLAQRAVFSLDTLRVADATVEVAIAQLAVIDDGSRVLIGARVGLVGTEALAFEPFADPVDDVAVRVGTPTAAALAQRGLSASHYGVTGGAAATSLSVDSFSVATDGTLATEVSGFRTAAPCGSVSVGARFDVGVSGGSVRGRVLDWEVLESSRPEWITRRAMPDTEEIQRGVERGLAQAVAPPAVTLAIGDLTVSTRELVFGTAWIDAIGDVSLSR